MQKDIDLEIEDKGEQVLPAHLPPQRRRYDITKI